MSARLRELIEKRNRVVLQGRAILEKAKEENRHTLTTEEQQNFDRSMADQEELQKTIEREQRQAQLEAEMASSLGTNMSGDQGNDSRNDGNGREQATASVTEGRYGINLDGLDEADRQMVERRSSKKFASSFRREIRASLNAQGSGANGSYLVTPIQVAQALLQRLDDMVYIRSRATVYALPNATSLGRVTLETDAEDADWTSELKVGGEEDEMAFGRRDLTPHPLAKFAKMSNKLLAIATIDPMALLLQRLAYKFSITEEKGFLLGDGIQKALGVFVPSPDGIPVSRDVASGNTATNVTMDGLIAAKYSLKAGYLNNAAWMFHRDGVRRAAQLRDDSGATVGTGQYLWQPSTQLGQPDRLLNQPVVMSEYVPNVFTSGKYVGILGDFSFYNIADALNPQIKILNELFAMSNQTGVIMRREVDGMPALGEAFVRVKLG